MSFKVQRKLCPTCIYSKHNPTAKTPDQLEAEVADPACNGFFDGYRICHHSDTACCRGFWNRHKDDFQLGQIAQRMDFVVFVDEDSLRPRVNRILGERNE